MRSASFQISLMSLAIVGGLAICSGIAIAQEKTSPPSAQVPQTTEASRQLVLHISAKKPLTVGSFMTLLNPDCVEVSIENRGKTDVSLVEPADGSDYGWRTPVIGFSVINLKDTKSKHPNTPPLNGMLRCGNLSGGNRLITLAPGKQRVIDIQGLYGGIGWKLTQPGRYRVVFYYTNDPSRDFGPRPGLHSDPRINASTACVLRSNEIVLTVAAPAPKTAK